AARRAPPRGSRRAGPPAPRGRAGARGAGRGTEGRARKVRSSRTTGSRRGSQYDVRRERPHAPRSLRHNSAGRVVDASPSPFLASSPTLRPTNGALMSERIAFTARYEAPVLRSALRTYLLRRFWEWFGWFGTLVYLVTLGIVVHLVWTG